MDSFRLILLAVGAVLIVGVYFWARGQMARRGSFQAQVDPPEDIESFDAGRDDEPEADLVAEELDRMGAMLADEPEAARPSSRPAPAAEPEAAPGNEPVVIAARRPREASKPEQPRPQAPAPDKVVALFVVAPAHTPFRGKDVAAAFRLAGLEFGPLGVFQYSEATDSGKQPVFLVANLVEPGTFDPDAMEQMSTPGLSFILQLPSAVEGVAALSSMVSAAEQIAEELSGELRDDTRSILTRQRIEHLRGEIAEFERKQRIQQARG